MSQEHKDIVKKVDEAFTNNSMEDFFALCADDVEWTMAGEGSHKGLDNIREWMRSVHEGHEAPAPKIMATKMIADGESVASYGKMSMKDRDGNDSQFDYCDIYNFRDGKIAKLRSFVVKSPAE